MPHPPTMAAPQFDRMSLRAILPISSIRLKAVAFECIKLGWHHLSHLIKGGLQLSSFRPIDSRLHCNWSLLKVVLLNVEQPPVHVELIAAVPGKPSGFNISPLSGVRVV